MSDEDEGDFEYHVYFLGPCTCDHDEGEHGWGSCDGDDYECPCEAGWEE